MGGYSEPHTFVWGLQILVWGYRKLRTYVSATAGYEHCAGGKHGATPILYVSYMENAHPLWELQGTTNLDVPVWLQRRKRIIQGLQTIGLQRVSGSYRS